MKKEVKDTFVVVTDHIHGILMITCLATRKGRPEATAGAIILDGIAGVYKSLCVNNGLKWIKQN